METWAQEKLRLKLGVNPLRANLGRDGVIYEPGIPGEYRVTYVSTNGIPGLPSRVRLRPGAVLNPQLNLPVLVSIGYDWRYEIVGVDPERAKESGYNLIKQNPGDPFNKPINQNQITTAFSHQTQIASKSVVVKPWIFIEAGDIYVFPGETVDLTSYIPAEGYHCLVLLVLKPDMTIGVFPSTDKLTAEPITVDDDLRECWTDAYADDSDNKPLWAWHLKDDQSVITDADRRMDVRQVINSAMTSSATAAPVDATYIVQTPNSTLPNEQALSALATGYVKNTTGTGVLSVQAAPIPVADGGTGASTLTANNVILGNGTSAVQFVAPSTNRNVLISNGTTWESRALVSADIPDLTQYALLAGRAGGQTLRGGTASGESLTLNSTANATKGNVVVAGFATFKEASTQLVLTSGSKIMPASDSTTAILFSNAAGTLSALTIDTTNLNVTVGNNLAAARVLTDVWRDANNNSLALFTGTSPTRTLTFGNATVSTLNISLALNVATAINATALTTILVPGSTATDAIGTPLTLGNNSTSTPVAGFGTGLRFQGQSSTTTNQDMGRIRTYWTTATHASRLASMILSIYDTAEHDLLTLLNSSTGATVVAKMKSGQTADIVSIQNSVGTALVRVASNGDLYITDSGSATLRARNFISPGSMEISNAAGDILIDPSGQLTVNGKVQIDTGGSESLNYSGSSVQGSSTGAGRTHEFYGSTLLYPGQSTSTITVRTVLTLRNNMTDGSTPDASFGVGMAFQSESSTTDSRDMARVYSAWQTATDASRSSDLILSAYYTSTEREGIRIRGGSSNAQIGFLGNTPISQYSTTGTTTGFTAGAGSAVDSAATFTGNTGSTAYTIGDIVRALKQYGLLTA